MPASGGHKISLSPQVWALAAGGANESLLATGAADATVAIWEDVTTADEEAAAEEAAAVILKQQDLSNALQVRSAVTGEGLKGSKGFVGMSSCQDVLRSHPSRICVQRHLLVCRALRIGTQPLTKRTPASAPCTAVLLQRGCPAGQCGCSALDTRLKSMMAGPACASAAEGLRGGGGAGVRDAAAAAAPVGRGRSAQQQRRRRRRRRQRLRHPGVPGSRLGQVRASSVLDAVLLVSLLS